MKKVIPLFNLSNKSKAANIYTCFGKHTRFILLLLITVHGKYIVLGRYWEKRSAVSSYLIIKKIKNKY